MSERRPTNSELRIKRLEETPAEQEEKGILELFDDPVAQADEDAPLARDDDDQQRP